MIDYLSPITTQDGVPIHIAKKLLAIYSVNDIKLVNPFLHEKTDKNEILTTPATPSTTQLWLQDKLLELILSGGLNIRSTVSGTELMRTGRHVHKKLNSTGAQRVRRAGVILKLQQKSRPFKAIVSAVAL